MREQLEKITDTTAKEQGCVRFCARPLYRHARAVGENHGYDGKGTGMCQILCQTLIQTCESSWRKSRIRRQRNRDVSDSVPDPYTDMREQLEKITDTTAKEQGCVRFCARPLYRHARAV